MTGAERDALRRLIDGRVRELTARAVQAAPRGFCAGCGCPYDELTPACRRCRARHRNRRLDGYVGSPPCCRACGCLYKERTNGCSTCWSRHHHRRARAAA